MLNPVVVVVGGGGGGTMMFCPKASQVSTYGPAPTAQRFSRACALFLNVCLSTLKMPDHIIGKTLFILEILEISGYTNEFIIVLISLYSHI